jgi:hypothetical protein
MALGKTCEAESLAEGVCPSWDGGAKDVGLRVSLVLLGSGGLTMMTRVTSA